MTQPKDELTRIWIKAGTLDLINSAIKSKNRITPSYFDEILQLQRGSDTWDERLRWLLSAFDDVIRASEETAKWIGALNKRIQELEPKPQATEED